MATASGKDRVARISTDDQSFVLPGEEKIHISHICAPEGNLTQFMFEESKTLYEGFLRGVKVSNDGPCLGERTGEKGEGLYKFLKYSEVLKKAHDFGSGLVQIGIPPGQKSHVGIYGKNCTSWVVAALSCDAYSRVSVPLYDTLGPQALEHIINEAELAVVVCTSGAVKGLLDNLKNYPVLKHLVTWGEPLSEDLVALAKQLEVSTYTVEEIEKRGQDQPVEPQPPSPEDICVICYTSGTTGLPKGALIQHKGLIACCAAVEKVIEQQHPLNPQDVHFSFLPLAHIMERAIEAAFLENGCQIGFYHGDPKVIAEDIKTLKPTIFAGVPRFYCKIYDKVMIGVSSSKAKSALLKAGMWFKGKDVDKGVYSQKTIFDAMIFKRFRELFGGRLRMLVTGASPMPKDVLRFYRIALGCPFFEMYGSTEGCSGITCTLIDEHEPGHVGPPLSCVAIKLVDVPELNYFSKNDEGEICFRGPSCFVGYYKNEEKTAETIDKDGWVHSGDVGKWLPNGALKVIDRKKQIFKTQQGEYIAPERIENAYRKSLFVDQVFLYGDSLKAAVVAVVVPDLEYLTQWASSHNISGDPEQICSNKAVYKVIFDDITKAGIEKGLKSFEQAKVIHLHPKPFTPDEGLVTPTLKLVRRNLQQKFQQQIDTMYEKIQ